jgi:hypothetical protein
MTRGAVFLRKYEPSLRAAARARRRPSRRPLPRRFDDFEFFFSGKF